MKRFPIILSIVFGIFLLAGADGCSSDPNVEGAKLDLRNKDYDRALENLNTAIEKNPANAEAYELKGRVLSEYAVDTQEPARHVELVGQMVQAFDNALEYDAATYQADVTRTMRYMYVNEMNRGISSFEAATNDESKYEDAATYFKSASNIEPDSASAYVNLAYVYMNSGQTDAAIQPFETAIEKGDNEANTYRFLADLYRAQERYQDAVVLLEEAGEMYPDNEDVQTELLNAYQLTGQTDKAMDRYAGAVERTPDNALLRYNYGTLLLMANDYDAAIEQLKAAVEIDPQYGGAYYNLGSAYVNQGVDIAERISAMDQEDVPQSLMDQRREQFAMAIPPLEKAKALFEAEGESTQQICVALYQSYVQTGANDKAQSVATCAGYEDN